MLLGFIWWVHGTRNKVARGLLGILASLLLTSTSEAIYALSPKDGLPAYCTVFNHMVKSGGTSIKEMLIEGCRNESQREPGLCTCGDVTTSAEACYDALYYAPVVTGYGELLRNLFQDHERECSFFTMMRHPIDRLVSAFFYCPEDHDLQGRPLKWCGSSSHPDPVEERLVDFARRTMWKSMAYRQMMHSIYCPPLFPLCDEAHKIRDRPTDLSTQLGRDVMANIKDILATYTAVGISEEWELSMRLFNATIKAPLREWRTDVVLNTGPQSKARQDLLKWAHSSQAIHDAVETDLVLYDFALELFKKQTHEVLGVAWEP